MDNEITLRFVNPNGLEFFVGNEYPWRFQKNGGLSGFSDFSADLTYDDNYARNGGTTWHARLSKKDRTVKLIYLYPENNDIARQQFIRFFKYNLIYKVYVKYMGREMYAEGRLYKMALSDDTKTYKPIKVTMTFAFDNPFLSSADDFGKDIAEVLPKTAFPYLSKIGKGKPQGIFNFDRTVEVYNDGEEVSYPRIVITARAFVENPKILINDNYIRILDILERDDVIEINTNVIPPTVKKNGVNILGKCDRTSNFDLMYLVLGQNTIKFDADNGTDEMIVSVHFRKVYTMI